MNSRLCRNDKKFSIGAISKHGLSRKYAGAVQRFSDGLCVFFFPFVRRIVGFDDFLY